MDEDQVDDGLDGQTVDETEVTNDATDEVPVVEEYDPTTHTGKEEEKEKDDGARPTTVAPDSSEQIGDYDTSSKLSNDGTGRTVEETVKEAEDNGGANDEATSEQESRTLEDQVDQSEYQAGEEAQKAADTAAQEMSDAANNNAQVSDDDLAAKFGF